MAIRALGLIEVSGMLSAIVASDAALKSADVNLLGNRRIRGGLTTVELYGDVAAVQSAVEAGVRALEGTNNLISSHVIARLDEQVENMLLKSIKTKKPKESEVIKETQEEPVIEEKPMIEETETESSIQLFSAEEQPEESSQSEADSFTKESLSELKVTQLRALAYKQPLSGIEVSQIKNAEKDKLIEALVNEGGNN